jgi:Na+/H+ antiporter NhaD/arsenite permease-like protein
MSAAQAAAAGILVGALVLQALVPRARLVIVLGAAALSMLAATLFGTSTASRLLAGVPWDVLVIVVSLGLLSEVFASSRMFGLLAVAATRASRADPLLAFLLFAVGMYAVSGLVNNLTALLLVLPVLLGLMKLLGVTQRYASWTLGGVLVACNLGGAATPIGDFPAILLLGQGAMEFRDYLVRAAPQTAVALAVFLTAIVALRPARGMERRGLSTRLAVRTIEQIHRRMRLDKRRFVPAATALALMLVAWTTVPSSWRIGPELIAALGCILALAAAPRAGEELLRRRVDVEATLFLLALFLLVGAVRDSGAFAAAGELLIGLPVSEKMQVVVFLVFAAVLTGLFSAGPGMAALLDVAQVLAARHEPAAIYVGLALSVCAGSSLFLTAATSGPLSQALTERANIQAPPGEHQAAGGAIRFGFTQFAPVGLLGFGIILATGLTFALTAL